MSALPATDLPRDHRTAAAHTTSVAGQPLDRGPRTTDAHTSDAAVDPSAHLDHSAFDDQCLNVEVGTIAGRAKGISTPMAEAPGQPSRDGQSPHDAHEASAAVAATLPDHGHDEIQHENVGSGGDPSPPAGSRLAAKPIEVAGRLEDVVLAITADLLDDLERVRIATENRVRSLAQVKGLDGTPEEARMAGIVEGILALEHDAELELQRAMRSHPLGPWVRSAKGVGEKQAGRLLAAIGDPYIHGVTGEPRTVSQLWAYSGYHVLRPGQCCFGTQSVRAGPDLSQGGVAGHAPRDAQGRRAGVAPSRARGQKANWNAQAKMRAYLVAESCLKQLRKPCSKPDGQAWADHGTDCQCSPYRRAYDEGRRKYADAVHQIECRRCGPAGKPAAIGSGLSEGHKHARSLRLVAKEVLRDLWLAARDVH